MNLTWSRTRRPNCSKQWEAATKLLERAFILLQKSVVNVAIRLPAAQSKANRKGFATALNKALCDTPAILFNGNIDLRSQIFKGGPLVCVPIVLSDTVLGCVQVLFANSNSQHRGAETLQEAVNTLAVFLRTVSPMVDLMWQVVSKALNLYRIILTATHRIPIRKSFHKYKLMAAQRVLPIRTT